MNGNKEIKIFKDHSVSFKESPDYKYKVPPTSAKSPANKRNRTPPGQTKSRSFNLRSSLRHSQSLTFIPGHTLSSYCDPGVLTETAKAQLMRDGLDRRVQDLTSTVSFSLDVFEDMVPEMLPYYKAAGENLFSIPRGLQKAGTPPCFYSSRNLATKDSRGYWPVSHLPCILKNCAKKLNHSHTAPINSSDSWNKKPAIANSSRSTIGSCPSRLSVSSARSEYEDERFLSQLSPSTVELIVSRMTHGLQQERLKKKFKISTKTMSEPDPISIF
ncbi:uncharacterized protein LOC134825058 [Bolinopsis microptera]|uniref:uncharacterized protein LOC134825058 n=1 Tax=Bolinopsis microptera TaxID=2820187 RepID=UPI00307AF636